MPNNLFNNVESLARSFIDMAVYEKDPLIVPDDIIPGFLAASNRCEGFAIALIRILDDDSVAFAALMLAAMAAKESRIRRLALMGLTFSKYQSVDDVFVSVAFDPDERLRRLALECAIFRKSSKLSSLCEFLMSDADPELSRVCVSVKNGEVIPFLELESPDALGLKG